MEVANILDHKMVEEKTVYTVRCEPEFLNKPFDSIMRQVSSNSQMAVFPSCPIPLDLSDGVAACKFKNATWTLLCASGIHDPAMSWTNVAAAYLRVLSSLYHSFYYKPRPMDHALSHIAIFSSQLHDVASRDEQAKDLLKSAGHDFQSFNNVERAIAAHFTGASFDLPSAAQLMQTSFERMDNGFNGNRLKFLWAITGVCIVPLVMDHSPLPFDTSAPAFSSAALDSHQLATALQVAVGLTEQQFDEYFDFLCQQHHVIIPRFSSSSSSFASAPAAVAASSHSSASPPAWTIRQFPPSFIINGLTWAGRPLHAAGYTFVSDPGDPELVFELFPQARIGDADQWSAISINLNACGAASSSSTWGSASASLPPAAAASAFSHSFSPPPPPPPPTAAAACPVRWIQVIPSAIPGATVGEGLPRRDLTLIEAVVRLSINADGVGPGIATSGMTNMYGSWKKMSDSSRLHFREFRIDVASGQAVVTQRRSGFEVPPAAESKSLPPPPGAAAAAADPGRTTIVLPVQDRLTIAFKGCNIVLKFHS